MARAVPRSAAEGARRDLPVGGELDTANGGGFPRDQCLSHPLPIENGFFVLPDRPGLGFDIDESVLAAHPGLRTPPADRAFYI